MDEVKRVRYFKHEFLDAEDFNDEQNYHCQMRHMHNRYFHTWGIGHGLEVNLTEGQKKWEETKVTVSPGTAVDGQGREIVLAISKTIDFDQPGYEAGKSYYVTIKWQEQPGLPSQEDELKRWEEVPDVDTGEGYPEEPEITLVLTKVTLNDDKIIAAIDHSDRRYATLEVGDDTVTSSKIVKADGTSGQDTTLGEGIKTAHIQDGAVTTDKIADIAVTNAKLRNGSVNEDKLSTATRGKLVTNGNNHDHSGGDGAQIMHSSLNKNDGTNPHGTTAQDVKALHITGGTVSGDIISKGRITSNNSRKIVIDCNKIVTSSTGWKDMPNMSISITTGNNMVLILFKAGGVQTTSKQKMRALFRLLVDGRPFCYTSQEFHNDGWELRDVSLHWMEAFEEGSHNIKVQWLSVSGAYLEVCCHDATRSLIAIEL